jgi:mediator of RNA polymerase II transcription subunit 22
MTLQTNSISLKVRAGESLTKLVSELKEFLVLNDFPSLNESISQRRSELQQMQVKTDQSLKQLRDELSAHLHDMETAYYSSQHRHSSDSHSEQESI